LANGSGNAQVWQAQRMAGRSSRQPWHNPKLAWGERQVTQRPPRFVPLTFWSIKVDSDFSPFIIAVYP
jgi:hypothetical protein